MTDTANKLPTKSEIDKLNNTSGKLKEEINRFNKKISEFTDQINQMFPADLVGKKELTPEDQLRTNIYLLTYMEQSGLKELRFDQAGFKAEIEKMKVKNSSLSSSKRSLAIAILGFQTEIVHLEIKQLLNTKELPDESYRNQLTEIERDGQVPKQDKTVSSVEQIDFLEKIKAKLDALRAQLQQLPDKVVAEAKPDVVKYNPVSKIEVLEKEPISTLEQPLHSVGGSATLACSCTDEVKE